MSQTSLKRHIEIYHIDRIFKLRANEGNLSIKSDLYVLLHIIPFKLIWRVKVLKMLISKNIYNRYSYTVGRSTTIY